VIPRAIINSQVGYQPNLWEVTLAKPTPIKWSKQAAEQVKLHSIPETAQLLGGVSEMHVYRLDAAGELRAVDIATPGAGRAKTRVRSDDLAGYIERKTRISAGQ